MIAGVGRGAGGGGGGGGGAGRLAQVHTSSIGRFFLWVVEQTLFGEMR